MRANDPLVLLLGFLGLIPFLVCAYLACAWREPADARAMLALIAYGSVILSFLGGVHWGFALAEPPASLAGLAPASTRQDPAHRPRIGLGVLPSLTGWVALLIAVLAPAPVIALCVLIAGFLATNIAEQSAYRRGWVSGRYLWLRWVLTVIVVALLVTTVVLRLAGARIML
ncbi:MAG: DUF3429 domain-containing protein [Proteobacteria bacterium]|nr:DUF3429 domain-containing protein [Pseudomonadota bacterium]